MMRISLVLTLALITPVSAEVAVNEKYEEHAFCAKFADMMQAAAEARHEYDGLVAALRGIPQQSKIREFGFETLFVQKGILQIEKLHGQLTPQQIGDAMASNCVEMAPEISSEQRIAPPRT